MDYEGFSVFLLRNNRRSTTIKRHILTLKFLHGKLTDFNRENIDRFLLKEKEEGKANSYLNTQINTIRLYSQYKGLDVSLQKYKQFKKTFSIKSTLSDSEIETYLALPLPYHAEKRHWQIMTVFWSICAFTGMRPGEVSHLKIDDCDFGRGVFYIRQSKTNQPGISPIPHNIVNLLKDHIEITQKSHKDHNDYLFPSKLGGTHYSAGGEAVIDNVDWHYDFKKRLKILGIKRLRLTPYSFRHSFGTRLLEENVSLFHVKKLLHHNDLKSTLVYEHLTTKDLIQAIEKLPLIRKGTDPKIILQHLTEFIKSFHIENDQRFEYKIIETDNLIKFEVKIKS